MSVLHSCFAIFTGLVLIQQLKQTEATHNLLGSLPLFTNQYPNIYVYETDENGNKQDLIIPCSIVNPSSTVNYTWLRGDQRLPGSMVNGQGSLVILNVTEGEYASREGVDYYCIASDNIGFDVAVRSRTITVFYTYFNGFERMAESNERTVEVSIPVALKSDVALECDVLDAKPPPQIKWYNDIGAIQEVTQSNRVRFLDGGRYLYLRNLQRSHLERQYYCAVTNANLNQEISAPTRYMLIDTLTQGVLMDYKQIGDLRAFVGNTSLEFAYVGGSFGNNINGTVNILTASGHGNTIRSLGNVGVINLTTVTLKRGIIMLEARVLYNGMITMKRGTLTIQQVPRIISNLRNEREHFTLEENLMYTCEFEGSPFPNITFYFNGLPISADAGVNIVNHTLIIPSPQVSHSGIYQCIVSNEFGDDQAAWLLEIRKPILPQVQPYNFTELNAFNDRDFGALIVRDSGSIMNLSVNVFADPCPNVTWTFNGIKLGPSNEIFTYNNPCISADASSPNWTFSLNVRLLAITSGNYSTSFSNIAGTAQSPVPIAYITIPELPSVISLSLNDTCLRENSNISLRCNVRGFPRPRVEFQLNGVTITPGSGAFENFVHEFYDQISITNISMNVEGLYSCSALGSSSPEVHTQFTFCSVPKITTLEATPNLHIGESFFLQCSAAGIPNPTIIWTKDGFPLNANNLPHMNGSISSIIVVSNAGAEHNGMYTCIASNNAGSASASFLIKLQENDVSLSLGTAVAVTALLEGLILSIVFGLLLILMYTCVNRPDHKSNERNVKQSLECSANPAYGTHGIVTEISRNCDEVVPQYEIISDLQLSRSRQTRPVDP